MEIEKGMQFVCCICGKDCVGFGNNPYPIVKSHRAKCCDECNALVIAERIKRGIDI